MSGSLFDAAYAPDLAKVKAAGGIAMSVYLTGAYCRTCAQPSALHTAGLGVLGNYEEAASALQSCGLTGGMAIGRAAAAAYMAEGAPAGRGLGIAFSLDVNTPASRLSAVSVAFMGISAGLAGRFVPLVYGEGAAIDYLWTRHRVAGVQWLAAPTSWPGYAPGDVHVGLVQQVGSPVSGTDEDKITDLAALEPLIWWPAGSPYVLPSVPTPVPASIYGESDQMIVVTIDRATVPKGKPWPGDYIFNGSLHGLAPAVGKTSNVASVLKAVGQKAMVPITYAQYLAWGGK